MIVPKSKMDPIDIDEELHTFIDKLEQMMHLQKKVTSIWNLAQDEESHRQKKRKSKVGMWLEEVKSLKKKFTNILDWKRFVLQPALLEYVDNVLKQGLVFLEPTITTTVTETPETPETPSPLIQTAIATSFLKNVQKRIRTFSREHEKGLLVKAALSRKKYIQLRNVEEIRARNSLLSYCIGDLQELVKSVQEILNMNESTSEQQTELVDLNDKERYLCISDGYIICCLDLKQKGTDIKKVPTKISAINFLVEGLPVSMSMFRSGSRAYMVGGQEFQHLSKDPDHSDAEHVNFLYSLGAKNASSKVYELSLVESCLHFSDSDRLSGLIKPKFWPVAMKIKDQVHVVDSIPWPSYFCPRIEPSHEILSLDQRSWKEISSELTVHTFLVVGSVAYAIEVDNDGIISDRIAVFDSKTGQRQQRAYDRICAGLYTVYNVADILRTGLFGSCIPRSRGGEDLNVCIAIGNAGYGDLGAAAYVLNSFGNVLFYQRLDCLLEGFKKIFEVSEHRGIVFSVDEDENNMCAILRNIETDIIYITTFSVEQTIDGKDLEEMSLTRKTLEEMEFVNIVIKGWYVSELHTPLVFVPIRLMACFL